MANLNQVLLIGNLTKDPELRYTNNNNNPVASFSLAVNRKYKQGDDWKTEVAFFNVIVWGKMGENCAKYLSKGKSAFVSGRLANRSYETQSGEKRNITEIVADNVQFLTANSKPGESSENHANDNPENDDAVLF